MLAYTLPMTSKAKMSSPQSELYSCEQVISKGLKMSSTTLMDVANAIRCITKHKLYLSAGFPCAKAYFDARKAHLGFGHRRAQQLVAAANII